MLLMRVDDGYVDDDILMILKIIKQHCYRAAVISVIINDSNKMTKTLKIVCMCVFACVRAWTRRVPEEHEDISRSCGSSDTFEGRQIRPMAR